jgi:hypothetical protein
MATRSIGGAVAGLVMAGALGTGVLAHHGWEWTQPTQTEMTGKILKIYVGPPHPQIQIATEKEGEWTVDFGNPTQTRNAGFVEGSAKVGDTVVVLGNKSAKPGERLMKAVRVTIDSRHYVFYPERMPKSAP